MPTSFKKSARKSETWLHRKVAAQKARYASFMKRRPHRTFRLTRRNDAVKQLELPGKFSFTFEVTRTLWSHRKMFLLLVLTYVVFYAVLVGMQSQENYTSLISTLKETGGEVLNGGWGAIGQASILLSTIASSGVSAGTTESQQIFSVLLFLMAWLATVWLLRNLLAGHKVKLRDGLYNSGSPIFATIIVALFIVIQLIPAAIAFIGYSAALSSGLIAGGGAPAMLFWIGAALLVILSLFWITSSLFAMIIVTIPGMYPLRAIRSAGDMVLGRRVRILLRWLWMAFTLVVVWLAVMIPIILLDMGLKSLWPAIEWLPIVPVTVLIMAAGSTIWAAAYVYLLYRKVVDYVPAK